MDIYSILSSKPHNVHYLNRYIKFILTCQKENIDIFVEEHHICPKAKDMFPEYKSFVKNKWNLIKLTPRQHFIAHLMLCKIYPDSKSQNFAFILMTGKSKINSKDYNRLKSNFYQEKVCCINCQAEIFPRQLKNHDKPGYGPCRIYKLKKYHDRPKTGLHNLVYDKNNF